MCEPTLCQDHYVYIVWQAQLIDLRSDLYEVRATKSVMEKELDHLLLQLHACQLQLHKKSGHDVDSDSIKKKLVSAVNFPLIQNVS